MFALLKASIAMAQFSFYTPGFFLYSEAVIMLARKEKTEHGRPKPS
jgi:hypothetical protein